MICKLSKQRVYHASNAFFIGKMLSSALRWRHLRIYLDISLNLSIRRKLQPCFSVLLSRKKWIPNLSEFKKAPKRKWEERKWKGPEYFLRTFFEAWHCFLTSCLNERKKQKKSGNGNNMKVVKRSGINLATIFWLSRRHFTFPPWQKSSHSKFM